MGKHLPLPVRSIGRNPKEKEVSRTDFPTLYAGFFPTLQRYLHAFSPLYSEDIAQEAFLKAMEQPDFEALLPPQQKAWLYKTARRLAIDRLRRARREEELLQSMAPPPQSTVMDDMKLSFADVARLLPQLSMEQQQAVSLVFLGGLTSAEAGRQLSVPAATIRTRLRSAVIRLRRLLQTEI